MTRINTDMKAVEAKIDGIKKTAAKLDDDIQCAALSVTNHAHLHGDITLVNRLYNALGKGARHTALTAWLIEYAPVVANTDGASKKTSPFLWSKEKRVVDGLEGHMALADSVGQQWFDFKPSADPDAVFDLKAMLMKLGKKAEKDVETLAEGQDTLMADFRDFLREKCGEVDA